MLNKIKKFLAKETVLCVAAACAILTMFFVPPDREYLHYIDFRVLCLLLWLWLRKKGPRVFQEL